MDIGAKLQSMANGGAPPSVPLLGEHKVKPEVKDEPKVKEEPEDDDDDDVDGVPMEDDKVAEQAKLKHHTIPGNNQEFPTFEKPDLKVRSKVGIK